MNLNFLYKNWTVHNIFAHPLMEILFVLRLKKLGTKIHDSTLPVKLYENEEEWVG